MELPPSLVLSTLTEPTILHFKDKRHSKEAPYHYYFVLPVANEGSLIINIITSQIHKRISYYQSSGKETALQSLVNITSTDIDALDNRKSGVIECNKAEMFTINQLLHNVIEEGSLKLVTRNIPALLVAKVLAAVRNSPLVRQSVKNALKDYLAGD